MQIYATRNGEIANFEIGPKLGRTFHLNMYINSDHNHKGTGTLNSLKGRLLSSSSVVPVAARTKVEYRREIVEQQERINFT